MPPDMVEQLVADVQPRYRPQDYNLLFNNCNHFTNELGLLLTGEGLPVSDTASLESSPSMCARADYPVYGLHQHAHLCCYQWTAPVPCVADCRPLVPSASTFAINCRSTSWRRHSRC